jgi:hypothetical protein
VERNIRMAASTGLVTAHGILWNSVHPAKGRNLALGLYASGQPVGRAADSAQRAGWSGTLDAQQQCTSVEVLCSGDMHMATDAEKCRVWRKTSGIIWDVHILQMCFFVCFLATCE